MARFNLFGSVYTSVVAMYTGASATDFGGQSAIEAVMARITRDVSAALSPDAYRQMTEVDCEEVVRYATAGQTTATLGLPPVVAGTLHLWTYPSQDWSGMPGSYSSDEYTRKPRFGILETTGWTLTASTGAITGLSLSLGDRLYASYNVDVDSVSFSMPSLADLVVLGTAAEMGARLYSAGTEEWKLVEEYRTRYAAQMTTAREGAWIPDELRKLRYWSELERSSEEVRSVRLYRA